MLGLGVAVTSAIACRSEGPFRAGQTWIGKYICGQGPTDLTLKIVSAKRGKLEALFDFAHAGSETQAIFKLSGRYDSKTRAVELEPEDWVGSHPPRWEMVGLSGTVSPDGLHFSGAITHANCTGFSLSVSGR